MKNFLFTISICLLAIGATAQGGMWIPMLLEQLNEDEMQGLGMQMSAEDIYNVNESSLKDAIVHFGGFCTSEIISPNGLLLTNHHCGYGQIQSHSSLENNYLEDGFWAADYSEELPNPGLGATFIVRMEDVTESALDGVTPDMDPTQRQSQIDQNLAEIKSNYQLDRFQDVSIRPFYKGNQYFAFVTVTYNDVRLVGTPPSSIGKFGADTDNWVWPRHTGDFALFRIYAGPDNSPAEYDESNVPFQPKHYLPISLDGVEPGDFTLVFGFPGRTDQYLPASAVQQVMEVIDPTRIKIRDESLAILDEAMRANPELKIQYASKFARIANGWKKWIGEIQGLEASNALGKKAEYESRFMELLAAQPALQDRYGGLLSELKMLYKELEPFAYAREYHLEVTGRNVEGFRVAGYLRTLMERYENNGEEGYNAFLDRLQPFLEGFYEDYSASVDQEIFVTLMNMYMDDVDPKYLPTEIFDKHASLKETNPDWFANVYEKSAITDWDKLTAWFEMDPEEAIKEMSKDPLVQLEAALTTSYKEKIAVEYEEVNTHIQEANRLYMEAQMAVFAKKKFFPDANGTLRVTYGTVEGYKPRDAVTYGHVTYLDGVLEKYVPGDYEFDVPDRLLELYRSKDYGQYEENGSVPVCFVGTNQTSGGNSGSPAIDAYGNLIGLNFDRVWEGTMSDLNYDPEICRNIMVDIRYVLFIVDKFAGATHLIEEMTLVHPKQ